MIYNFEVDEMQVEFRMIEGLRVILNLDLSGKLILGVGEGLIMMRQGD